MTYFLTPKSYAMVWPWDMILQNRSICFGVTIVQISNVSGQWLLRYESLKKLWNKTFNCEAHANADVKLTLTTLALCTFVKASRKLILSKLLLWTLLPVTCLLTLLLFLVGWFSWAPKYCCCDHHSQAWLSLEMIQSFISICSWSLYLKHWYLKLAICTVFIWL